MSFISTNIKKLRQGQGISQQLLAERLHISRASLAKYEGGINEPSLDVIIRLSRYFKILVDILLTVDLRKVEIGSLVGGKYDSMIMPVQVGMNGKNMIEIVPHHAQAGYTGQYSDPGFIESLDQMALPFQELHGKCRAFPIEGDSMPPFGDGSFIIGRYISDRRDIREGRRYIVLSRDDGIVFKRIYPDPISEESVRLYSDNPKYEPYSMALHEIIEVWEFVAAITFQESSENYFANEVLNRVRELQDELKILSGQIVRNANPDHQT